MRKILRLALSLLLVLFTQSAIAQYTWEYDKLVGQPKVVTTHVYKYDEKAYKVDFEQDILSYQYLFNERGLICEKKDLKSKWRYTYNYNVQGGLIETIEYNAEEGKMVERINYRYGSSGRVEEERHYNSNEKMRKALVIDNKKYYQSDLWSAREDSLLRSTKRSFDKYGNLIEYYIRDHQHIDTYEVTKYKYYYDKEKKLIRIEVLVFDTSNNLKDKTIYKFVQYDSYGNWTKAECYSVDGNVIMLHSVVVRDIQM